MNKEYLFMYTEKRFLELTTKAINHPKETQKKENVSPTFDLEPASLARVIALSEVLGIDQTALFNELLSCALGDAHDGFLSAYTDPKERNEANQQLKSRVKQLLDK